jgi:hypothetical protein
MFIFAALSFGWKYLGRYLQPETVSKYQVRFCDEFQWGKRSTKAEPYGGHSDSTPGAITYHIDGSNTSSLAALHT